MIDPANVPEVVDAELLSRYATRSGHFRQDLTVKPNLFMPHPYQDLSVTRHLSATEEEIWAVGVSMGLKIYGKSVIVASNCKISSLQVMAKPLPKNPNHADIEGWPRAKEEQKLIALELAARASSITLHPDGESGAKIL